MRFGDKPIVNDFSATILRGDKVGLIGLNGAGKTTLLSSSSANCSPAWARCAGHAAEVAYFDQMRSALDLDATLADTISPGSEVDQVAAPQACDELPERLPVRPERANSPVRTLSGGERNRDAAGAPVRAACQRAGARRADQRPRHRHAGTARRAAADHAGTVFLVSHDRRFLDNVVTGRSRLGGRRITGAVARECRRWLRRLARAARERARALREARGHRVDRRPAPVVEKDSEASSATAPPPQSSASAGEAARKLDELPRAASRRWQGHRRAEGAQQSRPGRACGLRWRCAGMTEAHKRWVAGSTNC